MHVCVYIYFSGMIHNTYFSVADHSGCSLISMPFEINQSLQMPFVYFQGLA